MADELIWRASDADRGQKGVFVMGSDHFPPHSNQTDKSARLPWVTPMVITENADRTDANISVGADAFYSPGPLDDVGGPS